MDKVMEIRERFEDYEKGLITKEILLYEIETVIMNLQNLATNK